MGRNNVDWGHFEILLENYLEINGISKNKLANDANLQRTQLNSYCKNKIQRPDLGVLARVCCALHCDISDILRYVPPIKEVEFKNRGGKNVEK